MKKEIILPPHLYDRIRASAGEHGGIGAGEFFTKEGFPLCAHGHAWGTFDRYDKSFDIEEPELECYLSAEDNDIAVDSLVQVCDGVFQWDTRISFERWCEILNVKRGVEVSPVEAGKELAGAVI